MTRRTTTAHFMTALGLALALSACDDDARPTRPGPPVANPTPSPSATPTPEPTPTAEANRPPTVTVTSGGGCHPAPGRPCTVGFNATASDPDGDRIAYGWDGCAQGNVPFVTCMITQPGAFTATVLVSDGQGNFARASAVAHGTNEPPVVRLGGPRPPDPAPSNTSYTLVGGQPVDPEEDEDPNRLCTRATVTASGPCRAGLALCGGVGDAFDVDVTTLQGPGTCVVEARVADVWGAVGRDRIAFQVLP
jgi:PKD domain